LKQLYELLEDARDVVAEKMVPNYRLEDVYRAVVYAFAHAALREKGVGLRALKPLEEGVPKPLLAIAKGELLSKVHPIVKLVEHMLREGAPLLVRYETSLERVIEEVKREAGRADTILAYDAMSIIEQVIISAFLKAQGIRTLFLRTFFLNPQGLTRFMTSQLPASGQQTLRGVAQHLASHLEARQHNKNSTIDQKVHETGILGLDEFIKKVDISRIARQILEASEKGTTLVLSDHGYDIVLSRRGGYLYVVHGFQGGADVALLLLSRISTFMRVG